MGDYIMRIDGQTVKAASINGSDIKEIRNATTQTVLWRKPAPNYFYFEDRSGAANSISIAKTGDTAEWLALEYSTDKETWTSWDFSQSIPLAANGKVYLRGNNTYGFGQNNTNYHTFNCTGDYAVGGDVWSIMSENVSVITNRFMSRTFQNSATLVDCSQLSIPNMPMTSTPFTWTFASCTNLTSVMESIPVTHYGASGENSELYMMFNASYSLTNFPMFPNITSLNKNCMRAIASTSIVNPNTTLTYVDLSNIETVYTQALYQAFIHCKALEVVKIGISAWGDFEDSTSDYYDTTHEWLGDVHSTGVFCKNATLPVTRGNNYIPNNWSIADLNGKLYAPVITNNNGTITIAEAESGASCQIFYTVDGSTPTPENGTLYTQPFNVGSGVTVKAITHYNGVRADLITDSDVAWAGAIPAPTLISTGYGSGTGTSICQGYIGQAAHSWEAKLSTPNVDGVTYYINWLNTDNATTFPADPTTSTYDDAESWSIEGDIEEGGCSQGGGVEADSEVFLEKFICDADMVGQYVNIKVIGVRNGYVSNVSSLSMYNPDPIR